MEYKDIQVEIEDRLRIVTINKPKAMNSISPITSQELEHAFDEFAENRDEWVCILTAAGEKAFSAGNDVKWQNQHMDIIADEMAKLKYAFGGLTSRFDLHKPIIAAVNGVALGGGFEMVLSCDLIIAVDHVEFGLPEPKIGLMALAGGVQRLPKRIPYHKAMEILMLAKRVTATEAKDLGLVNEIVTSDKLLATAKEWAKKIMSMAPLSIQATKEAVMTGMDTPLKEAIAKHGPTCQAMLSSEDMMEGIMAFIEKREPKWKNK